MKSAEDSPLAGTGRDLRALVVRNISKRYDSDTLALDDVSLDVAPGMFPLLGPNGAGKSTLMRVIATLLAPDRGTIHLGALDVLAHPAALRAQLGYLPQEFGLFPNVPVQETLEHFIALKGIRDRAARRAHAEELLRRTNLLDVRTRPAGTLSGGMRQRLGVAIALAGAPRLLVLDEPTAGLDPGERHRLYDLLASIGEEIVVVLSTHIVDDVRELCTSLAIIDAGRVVLRGDPETVVRELRGRIWRRPIGDDEWDAIRARFRVISARRVAGKRVVRLLSDTPPDAICTASEASLEDAYFLQLGVDSDGGE